LSSLLLLLGSSGVESVLVQLILSLAAQYTHTSAFGEACGSAFFPAAGRGDHGRYERASLSF
jgi:hypothetical protein